MSGLLDPTKFMKNNWKPIKPAKITGNIIGGISVLMKVDKTISIVTPMLGKITAISMYIIIHGDSSCP